MKGGKRFPCRSAAFTDDNRRVALRFMLLKSGFHAAQQPSPMTTLPSPKPHRIRPPGTPSANRPLPRNLPPTRTAPTPHPPPPSNGLLTYQSPPSANPPSLPRLPRVSGSILPLPQDPVKMPEFPRPPYTFLREPKSPCKAHERDKDGVLRPSPSQFPEPGMAYTSGTSSLKGAGISPGRIPSAVSSQ